MRNHHKKNDDIPLKHKYTSRYVLLAFVKPQSIIPKKPDLSLALMTQNLQNISVFNNIISNFRKKSNKKSPEGRWIFYEYNINDILKT